MEARKLGIIKLAKYIGKQIANLWKSNFKQSVGRVGINVFTVNLLKHAVWVIYCVDCFDRVKK